MTRYHFLIGWLSLLVMAPMAGAQGRTMPAYLTTSPPTIDGTIDQGEWDAAGPPIVVTSDRDLAGFDANPIAEDPYGGVDDLSFQFRVMWAEPWTAYFLIEVNDDIAMEEDPPNLWERDQIELFFDGNDLTGNPENESFQWWDHDEPFGKFGVSRYTTFEGNPPRMSENADDIYADDATSFIAAAAKAGDTGVNANYFVEYAVSFESMYLRDAFEPDAITNAAAKLVADHTKVKAQISLSDDDNFEANGTSRSNTLAYLGLSDWRATTEFADLTFLGPYAAGPTGDFDGNGSLDVADINALTAASAAGGNDPKYDLNGDSLVDSGDVNVWVKDLKKTWIGDADVNGEFNSSDFVSVFTAGKYENGADAVWSEGDWNGNGKFESGDFVAAFTDGGYEVGPRAAVNAVPEPSAMLLTLLGTLGLLARRRPS